MSGKFSQELHICNSYRKYLISKNARIIQLVSPGSQATLSITYTSLATNRKKTIFPDIIVILGNTIIIGEIKPKYSPADEKKLLDLKLSIDGTDKIVSLIKRCLKLDSISSEDIWFSLVHGSNKEIKSNLFQFIISNDDVKILAPFANINE